MYGKKSRNHSPTVWTNEVWLLRIQLDFFIIWLICACLSW
jgi:hypothetical protein